MQLQEGGIVGRLLVRGDVGRLRLVPDWRHHRSGDCDEMTDWITHTRKYIKFEINPFLILKIAVELEDYADWGPGTTNISHHYSDVMLVC